MEKIKVYSIQPDRDCNWHTEDTLGKAVEAVRLWLAESEKGTVLSITVGEMTQEEYDRLPEYDGP